METALAIKMMTYGEAKECVTKINSNMTNIRSLVLDLYERKGWDALGYESWRECVVKEFQFKQTHVYELLDAAKAEKAISATAESPIPERQLRPLVTLRDDPEKQRVAWQKAVETAPEEIQTDRLYEKVRGVASFETYIRDRFGMARQTAYQLIDASKVIENVRNCGQIEVLPVTESQARPLARLKDDPEKQRVAWQKAVETAPDSLQSHSQFPVSRHAVRTSLLKVNCAVGASVGIATIIFPMGA